MSKLLLLALIALAGAASTANAAIIDVVYLGRVDPGVMDSGGSFGVTDADLSNDAIRVEYLFDTAVTVTNPSGTSSYSGSDGTSPSSALTATISINGRSVSFDGLAYGIVTATRNTASSSVSHEADAADGTSFVSSSVGAGPFAFPASVSSSYAYTLQFDDTFTGDFALLSGTLGTFTPISVTSQSNIISAVPLPASLPGFAASLIALGLIYRSRRRAMDVHAQGQTEMPRSG